MRLFILIGIILLSFTELAKATHYRAGEIRVEQIGDCNDLTIKATIFTYTKASSFDADRQELTLCWGDGSCTVVQRSNGTSPLNQGVLIGNDIRVNEYMATHTYPGRSTYTLTMTDPNRIGGLENVNFPFSINTPFHIKTTYTFLNPQFQGCNSTPELLQPPIDIACKGQPFQHNPNAYDPDGDSLSYELTVPFEAEGTPVEKYSFPDEVEIGINNKLTMDSVTGDMLWDAPQKVGDYVVAILIIEWRNGVPIDTTLRDMQISVNECTNLPPELDVPVEDEICVIAGELIEFDVMGTAPLEELEQMVQLQAFGGPLVQEISPATFERNNRTFEIQPSTKRFRWQTTCEHISDQYYSVVFKVTDNYRATADSVGLATLKTIRIKVVGPPPEDVKVEAEGEMVSINWEKPYSCEDTANEYFRGFSVWRKEGSNPFELDTCRTGLEGRDYERLTFDHLEMNTDGDRYEFMDSGLERGKTYCYRILAEFTRLSPNGNFPYNRVASLPSEEICIQLGKDIPLITNVSVLDTDAGAGRIEIRWSKPSAEDLDTLQNQGPYRYQLLRATGIDGTDFQEIPDASFISESFAAANDTIFIDEGLNTVQLAYNYKIEFYVEESQFVGETQDASSVFLSISPTDKANQLSWQESVPWINVQYVVFEIVDNQRIVLDTVAQSNYFHQGLVNGEEYCYLIQSIGSYGIEDVVDPIINDSQEACGIPRDDVPPCAPELVVANICNTVEIPFALEELDNLLIWTNPNFNCPQMETIAEYRIYYATTEGEPLTFIGQTTNELDTFFIDQPGESIAGCYAVSALDSLGNESPQSNIICVDNCPVYELPNTFTPNNDNANDVFKPYPYRFIERIDLQVFNRWGQLVFETTDADINWDGTSLGGEELAEGVYYYTCQVFEKRVVGIVPQPELLSGFIQLIKGN